MEARASFGRTGISKLFVGVVLVIVAVGLGIMAAYLATSVTATSGASAQPAHAAPGTILRQDNPVQEQAPAAAADRETPRHGANLVE
jgi:hypothetical protein